MRPLTEFDGLAAGGSIDTASLGGMRGRISRRRIPWRGGSIDRFQSFADWMAALGLFGDALVIFACLLFSFWLRFDTVLARIGIMPQSLHLTDYLSYIVMGDCSLICAFAYYGVYDVLNLLRLRQVGVAILKATSLWVVVFLSFTLIFKFQPHISRMFVTISAGSVLIGVIAWRYCFHRILQNGPASARLRQRILFVGWNASATRLSESVMRGPHASHTVAGYVRVGENSVAPPTDVLALGELKDVPDILRDQDIDVVILSSFDLINHELMWLANLCEREMRQFKVIPSFFPILLSGLRLESISQVPVLSVTKLPLDCLHNRILKRLIDIAGASLGLIIFAPVILFFCLAVYFESSAPVIYRQWRLGRNGRPFRILKIRSMRLEAERRGGPRWAEPNDPRRLRVGAFMRKWNIDELPQFWNVFKGEMSLVGPRPERPELIETFKFEVPHYNARHNIKAGITGWAQVHGLRGDTDLAERISCDLFYLENWNFMLDLQILAMTLFARENAY